MLRIHRFTYCLYYIFQSCVHVNSVVYQTEKKKKKKKKKIDSSEETDFFSNFSKIAFSEVTTGNFASAHPMRLSIARRSLLYCVVCQLPL